MKLLFVILTALVLAGCGTPKGYDWDTTPDHNGEGYVGGAP